MCELHIWQRSSLYQEIVTKQKGLAFLLYTANTTTSTTAAAAAGQCDVLNN
jgi:hypothetical protein